MHNNSGKKMFKEAKEGKEGKEGRDGSWSKKQIKTQYDGEGQRGNGSGYFGECTFEPRLSAKGKQESRSFKKFIEDQ